jgi:hypothetical protein
VGGTVGMAAATTTMTFGTASQQTKDCGATTADNGSDCGGSWDRGEARTTDVIVANGRSKDANPQGGIRRAIGAVNAINYGNGRGIAGATMMTTTTTTRKQTSLMEALTTAITCRPSPKRQKIARPSRGSCNKSSDISADGEDRQRRHVDIALQPLLPALLPSTQSLLLLSSSTMPLP